jgi:putative transposase
LSDALAARPAAVFRDLAEAVVGQVAVWLRQEGQALIRLIDASPITLRDPRCGGGFGVQSQMHQPALPCRGLQRRGRVRETLAPVGPQAPPARRPARLAAVAARARGSLLWTTGTSFAASRIRRCRFSHSTACHNRAPSCQSSGTKHLRRGRLYVFDKGYTDYRWWQAIVAAGALFVTRFKRNVCRRGVRPHPTTDPAILADATLQVGHKKPRGGADNPLYDTQLREIVVAREGREPLHLVTNDHRRSAAEIAELYKERWQIELFFKWIKQNLKIKSFLGRSENAVKVQVYIALIAFCLLRLFQSSHAASHKGGAHTLLAPLRVALFDPA